MDPAKTRQLLQRSGIPVNCFSRPGTDRSATSGLTDMSVWKCRSPVRTRNEDRGDPQRASCGGSQAYDGARLKASAQQTTSVYMVDRALTATTARGTTACTAAWMDWSRKVGLQENAIMTKLTASGPKTARRVARALPRPGFDTTRSGGRCTQTFDRCEEQTD